MSKSMTDAKRTALIVLALEQHTIGSEYTGYNLVAEP